MDLNVLSVHPSNGPFFGDTPHKAHQLPASRLQLFPLESSDVCYTCTLHLLLTTEVNICWAVLEHAKAPAHSRAQQNPRNGCKSLNQLKARELICVSLVLFSMLCYRVLLVRRHAVHRRVHCCCQ